MLSSARMRRRLGWIGGLAALVGLVVVLAIVVFPSSRPWSAAKMSNQKADIVHTPKQHAFDRREAPAVLGAAILAAMVMKQPALVAVAPVGAT